MGTNWVSIGAMGGLDRSHRSLDRIHVWVDVPYAEDRVRYGEGWVNFQVFSVQV